MDPYVVMALNISTRIWIQQKVESGFFSYHNLFKKTYRTLLRSLYLLILQTVRKTYSNRYF